MTSETKVNANKVAMIEKAAESASCTRGSLQMNIANPRTPSSVMHNAPKVAKMHMISFRNNLADEGTATLGLALLNDVRSFFAIECFTRD